MNKICILGAAGFIGTNLCLRLAKEYDNYLTVVDCKREYFTHSNIVSNEKIKIIEDGLDAGTNFDEIVKEQDIVYHLVSTNTPSSSNINFGSEILPNIDFTIKLLDACVRNNVKRIVFVSSGGTVYGKDAVCPIKEESKTNPITTYGLQKYMIEKLLYLYNYQHGLDYKIARLANTYGPYQRPNGQPGVISFFIYKALRNEEVNVYGDGSVIRDFIFIDDAVNGIINIANSSSSTKIYNLGTGHGTSINEVIDILKVRLKEKLKINYCKARMVDVPANYLDIGLYESEFGELNTVSLEDGIDRTIEFIKENLL